MTNENYVILSTRKDARTVVCPICSAAPTKYCTEENGKRRRKGVAHRERHDAYLAAKGTINK